MIVATQVEVGLRLPPMELTVTARTVIMGASASRDWQPQHHDRDWAVQRAGTRDIFLNTPTQAGWIERYLTDWTGPRGRLGRMFFRMRRPICPGDTVAFEGTVSGVKADPEGCLWVTVDVRLLVDGDAATESTVRMAIPKDDADNPWARRESAWDPWSA